VVSTAGLIDINSTYHRSSYVILILANTIGITSLEADMKVGNPTKQTYDNLFGGAQFDR
jgi:hypothetical protein|tara:strand:- start:183 stop:359 length:177 start_codon:yes stop_codon:yes gene_type:complete